jgi:type I restriction enzyme S subunit
MSSELRFGELALLRRDSVDPIACAGLPYVGLEHIQPGALRLADAGVASDVSSQKLRFQKGDILFGKLRPYFRKVATAPFDGICSTDIWVVKGQDPKDNEFLKYWMASGEFIRSSTHASEGSGMPRAKWDWVADFTTPLTSGGARQAIGKTLGLLDEKIALNLQKSDLLEKIAQSIFKSWFIDFDPVHAKSRGEQPEGMDAETAALFPDRFEESELGLIPNGWKAGSVLDLCSKVVNGSTPSRGNSDFWELADFPWFKTGELADNFLIDSSESISGMAVNRTSVKVLPRGSVLMAIYAAPTVGRLGILTSEAAFNQACTGMVPLEEVGSGFLYLKLKESRDYFNSLAIGAAQQNISKGVVEDCPVIIPALSVFAAFNKLVGPLFSMIESQTFQNANLASIRDALLPRLISGELEIPEELLAD